MILDTYAALLFINNKLKEAKTNAQKAIDCARKEGKEMEGSVEILKKIEALGKGKGSSKTKKK